MIDLGVWGASQDQTMVNEFGALVIGAVYGTAPVANAQVTIDEADADKGQVVYFDMPAGVEDGIGALTPRAGTSTGPSGLFGIYTMSMLHVTIVRSSPAGRNVNVATLVPANGLMNCMSIRMSSAGRLSVRVMRPSPTSRLPAHV